MAMYVCLALCKSVCMSVPVISGLRNLFKDISKPTKLSPLLYANFFIIFTMWDHFLFLLCRWRGVMGASNSQTSSMLSIFT